MCANAASAISRGTPESLHQSRKDDRIPCGTASIPFSRTSLEIVESDSGFPVGDGNTSPFAPVRSAASLMIFRAGLLRGTRWGRPVLVRSPGISHVSVVTSISSHVALRTSPLLVAVRVRILNAAMVAQWAFDASTVLMAVSAWLWCRARMWLRRVLFLPNPARMAALGSDSKKPSAIAHFMMAPIRCWTLRAVSGLLCHMGERHFMMSLLVTSSTCLRPMWGNA